MDFYLRGTVNFEDYRSAATVTDGMKIRILEHVNELCLNKLNGEIEKMYLTGRNTVWNI